MPGRHQPQLDIKLLVDTSCSMHDWMLEQAHGEIEGVLSSMRDRVTLTVMAVDAAVHSVKKVTKVSDVVLVGGGGTDMGVGLKTAAQLRPTPDLIIVITDGITGWPKQPVSGTPVIAIIIGNHPALPPIWIKSLRIFMAKDSR